MIDTHLHLWDPARFSYDWLSYVPAISGRMGPEEFAQSDVNIEGAVFVQADCDPAQARDEATWVASLDMPILGIVAYAPLELGNTPELAALATLPKIVGVRRNAQNEPDAFMTAPGYISGLIAAARAGLSVDMCIRARQMPSLIRALEQLYHEVPDARVVLDHLGKPDIKTHGGDIDGDDWRRHIETLAAMPGVFCKLSGLPTEADWEHWTPAQLRPYLDHALAAFGPQRCLFGGDWPVVNLAGGYARWQAAVAAALDHLPDDVQAQVWSQTARRAYHL